MYDLCFIDRCVSTTVCLCMSLSFLMVNVHWKGFSKVRSLITCILIRFRSLISCRVSCAGNYLEGVRGTTNYVSQLVSQGSWSSDRNFKSEVPYIKWRRCTQRRRSLRSYKSLLSKSCDIGMQMLSVFLSPHPSTTCLALRRRNDFWYIARRQLKGKQ